MHLGHTVSAAQWGLIIFSLLTSWLHCASARMAWVCDSPTMSLSVSGSCLKSFLKSSLRCLYVGLSTCRNGHTGVTDHLFPSSRHHPHASLQDFPGLFVSTSTWDHLVKTTHRCDKDGCFYSARPPLPYCGGFWQVHGNMVDDKQESSPR